MPKNMKAEDIKKWVGTNQYLLDAPEVYVPDMNSVIKDWDAQPDAARYCFFSLVEYSAFIANMGVSILYEELNLRRKNIIAERCYYPEPKLRRRMIKEGIPLFSKETFHQLKDFECLGFSSYYPLQFFGVPDCLTLAGLAYNSADRKEEDPIILMGGVAAFNPSPVAQFIDAFSLGDGEGVLADAVEIIHKMRKEGAKKDDILLYLQQNVEGFYVPKFYEERYYPADHPERPNQIIGHFPLRDDVPKRIKKAICEIKDVPMLRNIIVSNSEGQEMSMGSGEITRGCGHKCAFCEGSYRSQPYRERPLEEIQQGMLDIIKNTGAKAVTPYGFNLSDHHRINDILGNLVEHSEAKISMSSQHINHFTEELARVAYASGNRSITLALEAPTDLMRRRIGKGLTEQTVLDKFRIAFRVGFAKIKVYMVANLPLQTQEDIDYLVDLAKKLHDIQVEEQGDNLKTKVRFSWTPFNGKAHTPLEFAEVGPIGDDGLPVMQKTMSKVLDGLHELGYGFRIGTDSELSAINQCMSFGDRRMGKVIEETYKNPNFNYRGGMSIGLRKPMADFYKILVNNGLNYEMIYEAKDPERVFSWDFINMGVTKNYLRRAYFENYCKGIDVGRCQEECINCGGCTKVSRELFKKYWDHSLPEGRHDLLELIEKRFKKQTVAKIRFKIYVNPEYRYVHASKIKNYIRRAFFRIDAPVKNKITLSSDKLKFNDWTYGYDYGEILFYSKDFDFSNMVERLNATFTDNDILRFISAERFSDTASSFVDSYENILYSFIVPKEERSLSVMNMQIKKCLESKEFMIRLKVLGDKRDSTKTIDFDARPFIKDIWTVELEHSTAVYALLQDNIGVYELFPTIFQTSKRNVLKYEVKRCEYTLAKNEGAMDMFASVCEECGEEIEEDVLGNLVSEEYCLKHLTLMNASTTEERIVESSETESDDDSMDELIDPNAIKGDHEDDEDDD